MICDMSHFICGQNKEVIIYIYTHPQHEIQNRLDARQTGGPVKGVQLV
jgi:hypothetical protein